MAEHEAQLLHLLPMRQSIRRLLNLKSDTSDSLNPLIPPPPARHTSSKNGKLFPFRGLVCSTSSSEVVAPPDAAAAVRSAADWNGKTKASRNPKKRRVKCRKGRTNHVMTSIDEVADVSDVWCAPTGVVFGADAAVDCVVTAAAHRRDRTQREQRTSIARRIESGNEEILSSLLEYPSSIEASHIVSSRLHSGPLQFIRSGHRRSPADYEEMMMFQAGMFLGGLGVHDQYNELRLDVDNMTYEQLLELSEKIGYVSTGLGEEEILHHLRKPKHAHLGASPSQKECKCVICQEEYEANDDMGKLECGHSYHAHCIKQWLLRKNACPVCKTAIAKR